MNISSQLNCSVLNNKNEISIVLKNGEKIKTDLGILYFFNIEKEIFKKVAIFVKKSTGKAHYRNYIKRIIRYYIRSNFTLFNKYNRVIFFYNNKNKIKYKFLEEHLNRVLQEVY